MKTIVVGDVSKTIPWFLTARYVCDRCGGVAQPDSMNEVRRWSDHHGDESFAAIYCPTCGHSITVAESEVVS